MGQIRKLSNLAAVQQQLPGPLGVVIHVARLGVLGNVAAHEPNFPATHSTVGFIQGEHAMPEALYLAADKHDPAFQRIDDVESMSCLSILGDRPRIRVVAGFRFLLFSRGLRHRLPMHCRSME